MLSCVFKSSQKQMSDILSYLFYSTKLKSLFCLTPWIAFAYTLIKIFSYAKQECIFIKPLKSVAAYTIRCNIQQFHVLSAGMPLCILYLRTNNDFSPIQKWLVFRRFGKIVKKWLLDSSFHSVCHSVRSSVRPRATVRLPLDGFSWNLLF